MFGHTEKSPAEVYGSLRKKGYWSSATGQFPSAGIGSFGENARHRSVAAEQQIGRHRHPTYDHLSFSPIYRHFSEENRSSTSSPLFSAIFGVRNRQ